MAALLHDVGRRFGEKNHPMDGARMIEEEGCLPLSPRQCRAIAYLTRYHRGAVPKIGYDGILRRGDGRRAMRMLLGVLRAADGLDSRQLVSSPRISITMRVNRLIIDFALRDQTSRDGKWLGRRKKFRLLEETLGVRVDVRARGASAKS